MMSSEIESDIGFEVELSALSFFLVTIYVYTIVVIFLVPVIAIEN